MEIEFPEVRSRAMDEQDFRDSVNTVFSEIYNSFYDFTQFLLIPKGVLDMDSLYVTRRMTLKTMTELLQYIMPNLYGSYHKKFASTMIEEFTKRLEVLENGN